ncbi:hypothetical protein IC762_15340 [Bradyrhizobium genosp. L]|uniref:hypothetical protein n=1 Tax=Bradyrhizobium genosp. L TaxID=83637 RepID=UPI0018A2E69E|nr:hypothetical protein [Bradyrhizobium genosp. L]QPF87574.1 hypothetical protein IC762_15340 [Bradyrhizobium genosp. L]
MRCLKAAIVLALVVIISIPPDTAHAEGGTVGVAGIQVDFTSIIVALINLILPAVGGIATYLINRNVKNQQLAEQLSNAVKNAVGIVQQNIDEALKNNPAVVKLQRGDAAFQKGVDYVLQHAAEAISHFKIPEQRVAEKIEAKIGLAAVETNRAATESSADGFNGPLAPVQMMTTQIPLARSA